MGIAWLFPGQGTQHVTMGQALAGHFDVAREIFERADAALGFSLSKLCFEGPEAELTLTANAQPAIVAASIAALEALRAQYPDLPRPAFAAGHSLGEYSALVASGALGFEDAVRLVHLRGKAMQEAVPAGTGGMAAIMGASPEDIETLCRDAGGTVSPANFNAPGQIAISGEQEAVQRAIALAAERKFKAIALKVSAPFHCSLMRPAAEAVQAALEKISVGQMTVPVIANFDAEPNSDPSRVAELLVRQIDGPVLWEQSMRRMAAEGVDHALEIGPGRVLAGLMKRIDRSVKVQGVADPEAVAAAGAFLA